MADFAIITFRNTGPIKTWSDMRAANVHNARTKPIEHAVEGTPGPQFLIGGNDLVADVKRKLRAAKIDPDRLRKNGVIAYEAILTASANFFSAGTEAERQTRLEVWTSAQVEWATKRYGPHRIASMVLHIDEKTPHVHLVVLPLDVKSDKRRRDATEVRWGLVGRTISGPGRFDEVQDDYAAAMAPFGLVRGVRGSGRKHEPVPVYLARMEQKEREADERQRSLIASQREADLDRGIVAAERHAVAKLRAEAIAKAEAAERELADARELRARAERYRAELAAFADQLTDVRTQVIAQRDANRVERQRLAQIALQAGAFLDRVRAVSFPDAATVSATNAALALQAAARSSEMSRSMGGR